MVFLPLDLISPSRRREEADFAGGAFKMARESIPDTDRNHVMQIIKFLLSWIQLEIAGTIWHANSCCQICTVFPSLGTAVCSFSFSFQQDLCRKPVTCWQDLGEVLVS